VEYAYKGITCYGSSPALSNCEARFNQYAGISCEIRSAAQIRSCSLVSNAFAGLICELGAVPLLEKSIISENPNGILIFDHSLPDLGRFSAREGESTGENQISGNLETDVYNRSNNDVYAQNNMWDSNNSAEIQGRIRDKETNPSYGKVLFEPVYGKRPPILSRQFPAPQNTGAEALLTGAETVPSVKGSNGNTSPNSQTSNATGAGSQGIPADMTARDTIPPAAVVTPETLIVYREIFVEKPPEEPQVPTITGPVSEWQLDSGGRHYINLARPNYPEIYKRTKFEGKVIMEVVVGRNGEVVSHKVLRATGEHFTTAAEEALRRMRYQPETFQGQPVEFKIYESFIFKLDE
jgi:TonB family protein